MDGASGGFRGGGTPGPCPPLWNCFVQLPPPPFWNVKKMFRNTEMCRISPPPPRLGLARLSTLVALRKKGRNPPPPPPRLSELFLGLARLSRLARRSKKLTVFCAPPPFIKILDPPLDGAMERWEEGKWMWGKQRMTGNWCRGCVRGIRSLQWVRDVSGELKCLW